MEIREAKEEDIPQLVELWLKMMELHSEFEPRVVLTRMASPSYQSYLMIHVRSSRSLVLLVEDKDSIRGFCCAYICQNLPMFDPLEFGYISDIFVDSKIEGKGWGSKMLDRVKDWTLERGIHCLQLQVYSKNEQGKSFWRARGFNKFFERMQIDLDQEED